MLKLPPPVWLLIYVLLALAAGWFTGWPRISGPYLAPLGAALVVLGLALAVWAMLLFRRARTEVKPTSPTNKKLVVSGPFRFTRNPMYLGLVLQALGVALWTGLWPLFAAPVLTFATANWVHIPFEEAKMRRQFGETFDAYARKIRRWI